ncbi:MAG: prolipoprotein diacylglyceryl transferase [Nanoarchaeota archaeon]|nr:prolipoprotein diacylglyceryl transferase [Nanoarchaeota archaeon]
MYVHNINPDLIKIGPFVIRFYGMVYAFALILISHILSKKAGEIKNLTKDRAIDLVIYTMLSGIIGARIFHVLNEWSYYQDNLIQIFQVWKGGLAWFGGLLFGVATILYYCKKHNISSAKILDVVAVPVPFTIFLGRIANFINGEHWGLPTTVPWAMVFPLIDNQPRHPAQIYEAVTMLLLFFVMLFVSKKSKSKASDGVVAWYFLTFYSLFRFTTEFFRYAELRFIGLSIAQYMALVTFGIGLCLLIRSKSKKSNLDKPKKRGKKK